jgi:radical SAM superfamily enzyme YgiQ (UPF0313 family)
MITYGLESGALRLLDEIKKGITLEQSRRAVRWTKEAGIRCRATFMLGLPTETREESLESMRFAGSLGLDRLKFSLMTPNPGSQAFEQMKDRLPSNWEQYDTMAGFTSLRPPAAFRSRDVDELSRLQRKGMTAFYLAPRRWGGVLSGPRARCCAIRRVERRESGADYSHLNATTGSTLDARRAGT